MKYTYIHSLLILIILFFIVGCKQEYFYEETGTIWKFPFKANNDEEAIATADRYLNRSMSMELSKIDRIVKGTSSNFDNPVFPSGYSLHIKDFNGRIIKEAHLTNWGIDHSHEVSGNKALGELLFGMSEREVKQLTDFGSFKEGTTKEYFSTETSGKGEITVKNRSKDQYAQYVCPINTLEGDFMINAMPYQTRICFWQGALYRVDIDTPHMKNLSQRLDMIELRNVLWLAYGIPSSFRPERDNLYDLFNVAQAPAVCDWTFNDKRIHLGYGTTNDSHSAHVSITYTPVMNKMCSSVRELVLKDKEDAQSEKMQKQKALDKAASLF